MYLQINQVQPTSFSSFWSLKSSSLPVLSLIGMSKHFFYSFLFFLLWIWFYFFQDALNTATWQIAKSVKYLSFDKTKLFACCGFPDSSNCIIFLVCCQTVEHLEPWINMIFFMRATQLIYSFWTTLFTQVYITLQAIWSPVTQSTLLIITHKVLPCSGHAFPLQCTTFLLKMCLQNVASTAVNRLKYL